MSLEPVKGLSLTKPSLKVEVLLLFHGAVGFTGHGQDHNGHRNVVASMCQLCLMPVSLSQQGCLLLWN